MSNGEEVLSLDTDGAALISYHRWATATERTGSGAGMVVWVGEEPGVALSTADGTRKTLLEPHAVDASLESAAWADLRGDAVAIRVASVPVDTASEGVPGGTFYFGTRDGTEQVPELDGPTELLSDMWVHTPHVAGTSFAISAHYQGVFQIDPLSGSTTPIGGGDQAMPITYRDLCAPSGVDTIGYIAMRAPDSETTFGQWTATWTGDGESTVTELTPIGNEGTGVFSRSCGPIVADALAQTSPTQIRLRTPDGERVVSLPTSAPVANLWLPEGYLVAQTNALQEAVAEIYVVRLRDGAIAEPIATCGNAIASGEYLAIGVGTTDGCAFYIVSSADLFAAA
jgi:hypothetical protein